MKKLKFIYTDEARYVQEQIDAWYEEENPIIISAKLRKGSWNYELLIMYDDGIEPNIKL